jgi:hypothetical protein
MQWFSPEAAESVLASLLKGGWIGDDDGVLSPTLDISKIEIPLGWRPIARRLLRLDAMPLRTDSTANETTSTIDGGLVVREDSEDGGTVQSEVGSNADSQVLSEGESGDDSQIETNEQSDVESEAVIISPPRVEIETDSTTTVSLDESEIEPLPSHSANIAGVPPDPWVDRIPALLNSITKSSGLERKEVMRRAQRKRLALGPVTLWMALLLVAREQRIELSELMA